MLFQTILYTSLCRLFIRVRLLNLVCTIALLFVFFVQPVRGQVVLEAEDAFSSLPFDSTKPGASGNSYLELDDTGFIEWEVETSETGEYTLEFRYATDSNDIVQHLFQIEINGNLESNKQVFSDNKFSENRQPESWQLVNVIIHLEAGVNVIRVSKKLLLTKAFDPSDLILKAPLIFPNILLLDKLTIKSARFLTEGGKLQPAPNPYKPECNPSGTNDLGYSNSYYGKIDPSCKRSTLVDFRKLHGFDTSPNIYSAEYINAMDLGFGRRMSCLGHSIETGRLVCYVKNTIKPKDSDPAVSNRVDATVAMERIFTGSNNRPAVTFYVYDQDEKRINQLPLDSEGPKAVPQSCHACHSGYNHANTPVGGQFLPFDIGLFEDWPGHPKVDEQLDSFRQLNKAVQNDASYPAKKRSLVKLINGWYNGAAHHLDAEFKENNLPQDEWYTYPDGFDWIYDVNDINGKKKFNRSLREYSLYRTVYAQYCRSCHVGQGPAEGVNRFSDGLDWTKAAVFEDQAYYHICDYKGGAVMPHAELTEKRFANDQFASAHGGTFNPKEVLCRKRPEGYILRDDANAHSGKTRVIATCRNCHSVTKGTVACDGNCNYFDEQYGGDLSCKGSHVYKRLGLINSNMNGYDINDQQVADIRAYLNSFDSCKKTQELSIPDPKPAPKPTGNQPFTSIIVAQHSQKCLDIERASMKKGTNASQFTCKAGRVHQTFIFTPVKDKTDVYIIQAKHSGLCLDIKNKSQKKGANLLQWTCRSDKKHQQFRLKLVGDKRFQLSPVHSQQCLDVNRNQKKNSANILQWTCGALSKLNQQWKLPGYLGI